MKKNILILSIFLILALLSACGKGEPDEVVVVGPYSLIGGELALEGVRLGESFEEMQKILSDVGITNPTAVSDDETDEMFYDLDTERTTNGETYNYMSFTSFRDEDSIAHAQIYVEGKTADELTSDDFSVLEDETDAYFRPYKDAVSGFENVLITKMPDVEFVVDENGNREDVIFFYGREIYTLVFVDGKTVEVSSREEASKIENAQIFEIHFMSEPLTESFVSGMKSDPEKQISVASVHYDIMTSEFYDRMY